MGNNQKRVVLRIGGSILFPDLTPNQERIISYARSLKGISENVDKLVVVVGGGRPARSYISLLDSISEAYTKDLIGIEISQLNARILKEITSKFIEQKNKIAQKIPENAKEIVEEIFLFDLFFCGGFRPGQSTTGVGAIISEAINADLLAVATDVKGIYDKNPKENENANRFTEIKIDKLIEILASSQAQAGTYKLLDLPALKILERTKIPTIVFDGKNSKNLNRIINSYFEGKEGEITSLGSVITF